MRLAEKTPDGTNESEGVAFAPQSGSGKAREGRAVFGRKNFPLHHQNARSERDALNMAQSHQVTRLPNEDETVAPGLPLGRHFAAMIREDATKKEKTARSFTLLADKQNA